MTNNKRLSKVLLMSGLAFFTNVSFGSGFQLLEQNVSGLGTAYSGTGATSGDVSASFYNPATLSTIDKRQVAQSLILVNPSMRVEVSESLSNIGTASEGSRDANPAGLAALPSIQVAQRYSDNLVVGFAINPTFGMKTEYPRDSAARYAATKSELQVINLGAAAAYELPAQNLSFGVGFDAAYARAQLNVALGSGTISTDGYQKNAADGWGYGYHAGVLWAPRTDTSVGLSFRSMMRVDPRGESKTQLSGTSDIQTLATKINLPENLLLSVQHELRPDWRLLADLQWTAWRRIDKLALRYTRIITFGGAERRTDNFTEVPMYFNNSVRLSLGTEHQYNDQWQLKAGIAFDPTPTRDIYRTARVPDADRYWVAFGAKYQYSRDINIDIGYAHIFFDEVSIVDHGPIGSTTGLQLTAMEFAGRYKTSADLLGVQISWNFM